MNRDDDQELWDLLGKSQAPTISPFFARNVLRQVRQTPRWPEIVRQWLTGRRTIPAAALALVLCTGALLTARHNNARHVRHSQDEMPEVVAQIDPSDYEVVADLDDLLASQDDDSWDETSTL